MEPIRVLIIDDSSVSRRLLSRSISGPDIEVVGSSSNGRLGLQKLERVGCDVVILDVEMPEMGGLDTLKAIRSRRPELPVIMFSSLTGRGAEVTLDALALGANDYLAKPRASGIEEATHSIERDLVPKIKALCPRGTMDLAPRSTLDLPRSPVPAKRVPPPVPPDASQASHASHASRETPLLLIGSSTGGPNALAKVLASLPGDLGAPILIVQHMPPIFTRLLAERLNAKSALEVREASHGELIRPNVALVAPGDFHMEVLVAAAGPTLRLHQGPLVNSCRPAVDVLFESALAYPGPKLGVVLTGMGRDGLHGARRLKAAGNPLVVQDKETSVVWGMPGFIAKGGIADEVLPIDGIAASIRQRLLSQPHLARTS
ncbi:MAG: chemotaxis response regulator protein-glutamate methylesterase [Myxococcota bacterium]